MTKHSRLSTEVTIARSPSAEQTRATVGGPRPPEALASDRVELHTTIDAHSVLAEGGMAVVYRAHDRGLDRPVAMKVLKVGSSDLVRRGFEREAQLMGRLDHPGIVSVHGRSIPESPTQFFTMKLVEGHTIAQLIDKHRPPRGRALATMLRNVLRMCETLAYAHDRGLIHRDLKPENVMLGRYGECYIMDWGVALERDPAGAHHLQAGRLGEIIGTPAFMAPEQARGHNDEIDARTDVYGLGAILYYILTGHPPYPGSTLSEVLSAAREGRVPAPELSQPDQPIPARLSDIVLRALEPKPEHRFQTMMELHDALEQFLFAGEWFARRRFDANEIIIREGERGDRAYIVEAGECEVFRHDEHGAEVSLRIIGAGEVIGELALFTRSDRTASIRALTAMTLLEVTRDALEREMPAGSWTRQIIDTLAGRFLSMDRARQAREE